MSLAVRRRGGMARLRQAAPSRDVVTEIALHYDPLIVRYLFVPDPIARLLAPVSGSLATTRYVRFLRRTGSPILNLWDMAPEAYLGG